MKITKVCCQGCGASLDVDESIRYVTCNHCGSRLEVVHDPSITHTRVLEEIQRTTDHLAEEVKMLKLQNEVAQLDREWSNYRESMLSRSKDGNVSEPSTAGSLFGGLVALVGGGAWTVFATSKGAPIFFTIFGIGVVAIGLFGAISGLSKASEFNHMRDRYEKRRHALLRQLDKSSVQNGRQRSY
jgi:hypothetical protein